MAKKRKYRTKADEAWAIQDDERRAQDRRDLERRRAEEAKLEEELPFYSVCKILRSTGWFWAAWLKGKDFTGSHSIPWKYGIVGTRAEAVSAARTALGADTRESNPSAAGPAYQHLKRLGKL